jgi:hypothetical protein
MFGRWADEEGFTSWGLTSLQPPKTCCPASDAQPRPFYSTVVIRRRAAVFARPSLLLGLFLSDRRVSDWGNVSVTVAEGCLLCFQPKEL